jgi:hypothetical protein
MGPSRPVMGLRYLYLITLILSLIKIHDTSTVGHCRLQVLIDLDIFLLYVSLLIHRCFILVPNSKKQSAMACCYQR